MHMKCAGTQKPIPKRLDLVRRAKALGVTHGHLSRVINGKRESANLMSRLGKLIESESTIAKGK
jgi:plasmid maintenance system antidote protein VapI